jgi:hypothetical protein
MAIRMIEDQPLDMCLELDPGLFHGAVKISLLYLCLLLKKNIKPCVKQLVNLLGSEDFFKMLENNKGTYNDQM